MRDTKTTDLWKLIEQDEEIQYSIQLIKNKWMMDNEYMFLNRPTKLCPKYSPEYYRNFEELGGRMLRGEDEA